MKRLFVVIALLSGFLAEARSNPIDPYSLPFISEAQVFDSVDWAIELDIIKGYVKNNIKPPFPCSTSVLRLRIASSGKIYAFKAVFDTAKISVIRRASITGIPQEESVVIRSTDKIEVLDDIWCDFNEKVHCAWKMEIRPIMPGHSLINTISGSYYTSRPSIGYRGMYKTDYSLTAIDASKKPLPQIFVYHEPFLGYSVLLKTLGPAETLVATINIGEPKKLAFSFDSHPSYVPFPPPKAVVWTGHYMDAVPAKTDTVICAYPENVNTVTAHKPSEGIRFFAVPRSKNAIAFMLSGPQKSAGAVIRIVSLSGKHTASLKVPVFDGAGTHSIEWGGKRGIAAGGYVCKLFIDDAEVASRTIVVR